MGRVVRLRACALVKSVLVAVILLRNGGVGLKFADVSQISLPKPVGEGQV